ncbi:MAG: isomerase [Clostridiales bacterium]|jgi:2-dehydro-3-deoxyphosphogalactonate aldolase|nr:isomerase [Clostridiales bacterium]
MKLVKVEPHVIKVSPPHRGGTYFLFVKLITDEGVYGWGEAAISQAFFPMLGTYRSIMEGLFDRYLKGREPLEREAIFKDLYGTFSNRTPQYIIGGLFSAFDLALWDIGGKICNQPIYNLIGGKFRDRIKTYSYIYDYSEGGGAGYGKTGTGLWEVWLDPEKAVENALIMVDEGFKAIKIDPIPRNIDNRADARYQNPFTPTLEEYRTADKVLNAVRKAVGDKVEIILGVHGQMTTSAAIRFAKVIEPYDPLWYEEPIPPENSKEMAKVAKSTFVPISAGERLNTVFQFHQLLEDGAASIVQPDLGTCGGITECKKIADVAEAYFAHVAPHVWGGPIITAAAIQMDVTMPNFLIQESIYKSGDFFSEILKEPIQWKDGCFEIPTAPGLGIDMNDEAIKFYEA